MNKLNVILVMIAVLLLLSSCEDNKVRIAISKGIGSANYEMYGRFIQNIDKEIEVANLHGLSVEAALLELKSCSGLVLSGGPDVHPVHYGKDYDTSRCSIDLYRDSLEFALIKESDKMNLPTLAICRGAQIINVAYGGTLIVDIPEDTDSEIPHQIPNEDTYHYIKIYDGSKLAKISDSQYGVVNSNHHQSVDKLAEIFKVNAITNDGIIEGFEFKNKSNRFFMAVQWHPERMENDSRLSYPLAESFVDAAKRYKKEK